MLQSSKPESSDLPGSLKSLVRSRAVLLVLSLFLLIDGLLIMAHIYHFLNSRFHLSTFVLSSDYTLIKERGYSEWWEYIKAALAATLYALCYLRSRQPVYLTVAIICLWILADNFLQLHEHAGDVLALPYSFAAPLFSSAQETLGELSYFGLTGLLFSGLFWISFKASAREHRRHAALFAVFVLLLAFFGVGLDVVHAALKSQGEIIYHAFVLLEDGGELAMLSVICAAAVLAVRQFDVRLI